MTDILINGNWIEGEGSTLTSTNPADGSPLHQCAAASERQTIAAINAAKQAQSAWASRPEEERIAFARAFGEHLKTHKDELATLISREVGKPRWEALTEAAACIGKVEGSIAALQERRSATALPATGGFQATGRFRPLGVMLVLGPFNFPAHLPGGQIIPALIAGNTCVFKPSEQSPAVGRWLVDAWQKVGLPSGIINLIQGGADVATWAIDHKATAGVLFTGSYRAGCSIHKRLAGRPEVLLALEMGGNNPLVVFDTESVDAVVHLVIQSAYISAGQRCTCARRLIIVDNPRNRKMVNRLVDVIPRIRCGLPDADPPPFLSLLISESAADSVLETQDKLIAMQAQPLVKAVRGKECPALVSPGLLDVSGIQTPDAECFGPLLQLSWANDFQHAMAMADDTQFGLAAGLIGGTADDFAQFRQNVSAGVVNWNRQTTGASGRLAFGGVGLSGNHRPAGFYAADFCSDPVASLESEVPALPETLSLGLEDL